MNEGAAAVDRLEVVEAGNARYGAYLGDSVVLFNLPDPGALSEDGGDVFDGSAPSDANAEAIVDVLAQRYGRGDARQSVLVCCFEQTQGGPARIANLVRWQLEDGQLTHGEQLDPRQPGPDVSELAKALALNMVSGGEKPSEHAHTVTEPFKGGEIAVIAGRDGINGVVRHGSHRAYFKGLSALRALAGDAEGGSAFRDEAGRVRVNDELLLTAQQAESLRAAAQRAVDQVDLLRLRNAPIRLMEPSFHGSLLRLRRDLVASGSDVAGRSESGTSAIAPAAATPAEKLRGMADDAGRGKTAIEVGIELGVSALGALRGDVGAGLKVLVLGGTVIASAFNALRGRRQQVQPDHRERMR